jgi:hypothetical protein
MTSHPISRCSPASAAEASTLEGTWILDTFLVEDPITGERTAVLGEQPSGVLVLTVEGRLVSVVTPGGRAPPTTDAERATAFRAMLAYSGRYRVEGDQFIATVDVAWDEAYAGTEQVRRFRLEGDSLILETAPQLSVGTEGSGARGIVTWRRER